MRLLTFRKLLYPAPGSEAGPSKPRPNLYLPFQLLDNSLESSIKQMIQEEQDRVDGDEKSSLNGGLRDLLAAAGC